MAKHIASDEIASDEITTDEVPEQVAQERGVPKASPNGSDRPYRRYRVSLPGDAAQIVDAQSETDAIAWACDTARSWPGARRVKCKLL